MRTRTRPRPKFFFETEAEATMYEAEARHVREQISVHEHTIGVQNIVFSKQPIHNRNDCRWLDGYIVNIN